MLISSMIHTAPYSIPSRTPSSFDVYTMGSLPIPEPPTMEAQVHSPLTALETSLTALLTSLTTHPTYSGAPTATQSLLTADDSLTTALQALYTHQRNYARILQLRAEAVKLEEQVKSTIRACVDLRSEIGAIHPSILSHTDEESDDADGEGGTREIDYHTLLSFASKIGRHNTAAAREAEEESIRRLIQARQEKEKAADVKAESRANGSAPTTSTAIVAVEANGDPASQNLIPQHEKDWLDSEAAMARARSGMAFPAAENLRKGMLGRLQWVREQVGGEAAVEREVESMVAKAEGRRPDENIADYPPPPPPTEEGPQIVEAARQPSRSQEASQPRPPPPPQEKNKSTVAALDLDLWNEDDEDED